MSLPPITPDVLRLRTSDGLVPLGYVRQAERIFLVARERAAVWPVGILRSGRAELEVPGAVAVGVPRLLTDRRHQEYVLELFRSKYGAEKFARWYEHPARVIQVDLSGTPTLIVPPAAGYDSWLESEFDNVAADYDRHILGNRMNRLLRDRSLARLRAEFSGARALFEIGCGSGMETLPLLRDGHEIHAVDVSEQMLEVVRQKARAEGINERLRTTRLRARDLAELLDSVGPGSFDGGYSTYGALNCEPNLAPVSQAAASLLAPGRSFLVGVYNRWCLFELAGYLLSLQPTRAFSRRRNPVRVGASRFCIDVYAYSLPEFVALFGREFRLSAVEGVPVLLPPSDLTSYAEMFSAHFVGLALADAWIGRRFGFRALGDHFLASLVVR